MGSILAPFLKLIHLAEFFSLISFDRSSKNTAFGTYLQITPVVDVSTFLISPVADADFISRSPSIHYLALNSPLFPTSDEQCSDLQDEFNQEINQINAAHEECLAGAPNDDHRSGGTCSKAPCQGLHTALDEARKKAGQEVRICRTRVGEYQAQKRQEEEKMRREAEEADRFRRKRDQRDSALKTDQERREQER